MLYQLSYGGLKKVDNKFDRHKGQWVSTLLLNSPHKKRRSQKAGLPPGTLVSISKHLAREPQLSVYHYTSDQCAIVDVLPQKIEATEKIWLDLDGLADTKLVEKIGDLFKIHPLSLEDVVNTEQRSKLDNYQDHFLFILKMIQYHNSQLSIEQVSFVLGTNWLISFQEGFEGDVFGSVRKRLESNMGACRQRGIDYLFYALADVIVDHYFICVEQIGDEVQMLEEKLTSGTQPISISEIHRLRSCLMLMRKAIWPLRDALYRLEREENDLIARDTLPFLRDVTDHVLHAVEMIDSHREILTSLLEVYLSQLSHRQNAIMQRLTVMASFFLPLTFIVGVYGMNFKYFPELEWKYGYLGVWILMGLVTAGLAIWFKLKKWVE